MATKLAKPRSQKAGLPPGTLVHIGDKKVENVRITVMTYNESGCQEADYEKLEQCIPVAESSGVTWINVEGLHRTEVIEKLGSCFGLHPLLLEDVVNTDQRPKVEYYEDHVFIVLRMIYNRTRGNGFTNEQVSLILGRNYVISLQEGKQGDTFNPIREQIRAGKGRIRKLGADFLAYSLIDSIVDSYFSILEQLGEEIEDLEEMVTTNPGPAVLRTIHSLKREMILLRRSLWPLREVINSLERRESPLFTEATGIYLKDVYDHTVQVIDTIETYREMLTGMLDIYLSSISNRINEVMKVLTIISTIFIPLTFLAGVYGMNFEYFPEIHWRWGYVAFWAVNLVTVLFMLRFFRRKRWI